MRNLLRRGQMAAGSACAITLACLPATFATVPAHYSPAPVRAKLTADWGPPRDLSLTAAQHQAAATQRKREAAAIRRAWVRHERHLRELRRQRRRAALAAARAAAAAAARQVSSPPVRTPAGALSFAQLEHLWVAAGGPAWAASAAASVAECESGGNPRAYNPSGASGLWQILGQVVGGYIFDPMVNARNAVAKFRASGDSWAQWVCKP